jgi:hypothetical protein
VIIGALWVSITKSLTWPSGVSEWAGGGAQRGIKRGANSGLTVPLLPPKV